MPAPKATTHTKVTLGKVSSTSLFSLPDGRVQFEAETDAGNLTIVAPPSVLSMLGWDFIGMTASEARQ